MFEIENQVLELKGVDVLHTEVQGSTWAVDSLQDKYE